MGKKNITNNYQQIGSQEQAQTGTRLPLHVEYVQRSSNQETWKKPGAALEKTAPEKLLELVVTLI